MINNKRRRRIMKIIMINKIELKVMNKMIK